MKSTWISFFVVAVICQIGVTAWAAPQQVSNCPQCNSSPQYQVFESASQPIYHQGYENVVSYEPVGTYQSPVIQSEQYSSQPYYQSQVVSNSINSGQVVYGEPVYYGSTSVSPVVHQGSYSGTVVYPVVENSITSYPAVSTPVYSSLQVYSSQSYPSQGLPTIQQSSPVVRTTGHSGNYYASTTNPQPRLAQQKASQAAQMSFRDHVGGSLGGAKFEGVGWSNQSPQTAIQNCCYWGQRTPAQIGVSKSQDGCWYACVLYH